MYDIIFIGNKNLRWKKLKEKFPLAKFCSTLQEAKTKTYTKMFWVVWDDIELDNDFKFDYVVSKWDENYIHVFLNDIHRDGVILVPKNTHESDKEIKYRFFTNKKEIDIAVSKPSIYDVFEIDSYDDYLRAMETSTTEMFWMSSRNIKIDDNFKFDLYFSHHNSYDRNTNHAFLHQVNNKQHYKGVYLLSKNKPVTKKEIIHRHIIDRKEWDIIASGPKLYDIFEIDSYDEYLTAMEQSTTEMFWMSSRNIKIDDNFKFDLFFDDRDDSEIYNRNMNHAFIHQVGDKQHYKGVYLLSKNKPVTKKEIIHRHIIDRKEWDIIASGPKLYDIFEIDSYDEYLTAMEQSTTEMFWMSSRNLTLNNNFKFDLFFDDRDDSEIYNRNMNHAFIHQVGDKHHYRGIYLLSKNKPVTQKEIIHRHIIDRKEWDIIASGPKLYDIFEIDSYDDYLRAMETSTTELFWMSSRNIKIRDDFKFDLFFDDRDDSEIYNRNMNHVLIHKVGDKNYYNGVYLLSKNKPVTQKEIIHRHIIDRKEWDIIASGPIEYDKFIIDSYEDYLEAVKNSKTEMFWIIPKEAEITKDFNFDLYFTHDEVYNRNINHVFKHKIRNDEDYNGVSLTPISKKLSKKEIDFRFLIDNKKYDQLASVVKRYDIIFISYNEENAEENFNRLQHRFSNLKRVHGVKGIHNAHIKAAKISSTDMFWVVDGDAIILDDFNFDYTVSRYENDIVHVWQSKNPINDLIYGYGGVKLLPRQLTLAMDTNSTDMTTSISQRFKIVNAVSNISAFNTSPFNTWKSAFRECVKLSSGIIKNSDSDESIERLDIWCSKGLDRQYGEYAISGAKLGRDYGFKYSIDKTALSMINNFEWLEEKFNNDSNTRS